MNMTRTPKQVGEAWFGPMWNNRDAAMMRELMAPGASCHLEGGREAVGPEGFAQFQEEFLRAVPDLKLEVLNSLADGDDVCVHWHATGNHSGDGMGLGATDSKLDFQGVTWLRVQNGQIVEGWDFWNLGALMQSLSGVAAV